jgi:MFS family permease
MLLLLSWAFISMLGYITLLFLLSDYAISIGLSRAQATQITAFLNLGTACGRPFIGVASDRFGRIEIAGVLTLVCSLDCLVIWLPSASFGVTVFFAPHQRCRFGGLLSGKSNSTEAAVGQLT